ncbi:lytic transglycosylase domain-containing protein [Candidatus Parcubacteria bacterium]|nr:MAG: lytic transglycosylase domain-containing protein [Candidatus Parcubacteria bacterium]
MKFIKRELTSALMLYDYVLFYAAKYNLREDIIRAIVWKESSGNTFAIRYEPMFFTRYIASKSKQALGGHWPREITERTERVCRAMSWGAMQVMGQTAREIGFTGLLPELCLPEIGVKYGCKYLKSLFDKADAETLIDKYKLAVAKYNGGPNNPNFDYAASIFKYIEEL